MPKHYSMQGFFLSSCAQTSYRMARKPSYHMLRTNMHRRVLFSALEVWCNVLQALIIREVNAVLGTPRAVDLL